MTKLADAISAFRAAEYDSEEYHAAAKAAWEAMSGAERESVYQHLSAPTPIWDGDHVSKSGRDGLLVAGLAVRVCHHGEQGYTAAMYPAYSLFRSVKGDEAMRELQKLARERTRRNAQKLAARQRRPFRWPWSGVRSLESILAGSGK